MEEPGGRGGHDERGQRRGDGPDVLGQPAPDEQHRDGEHADHDLVPVQVGDLAGELDEVVPRGVLRAAAEHHVELGERDDDADAGQHAVHDGGRDGERGPRRLERAEQHLDAARQDGDEAGGLPAVGVHEPGDDHGEAGRRAADHEGRAAEQARDDAAHGGGDQPGGERRAGGHGDAQGQGHGDEEHHQRRR
ncbi:hypothetical protein GCM10020001_005770 [Nonomuraea salmonea]